jgi:adenylate cyclase
MVETIMDRGGVVDKYIGDAIMAIFGAPTRTKDDAVRAVLAGLEMTESLEVFNLQQRARGLKEWRIGVGVNYGIVTVGNIGCDKKMNYTVIGDPVNLASRLEGATKMYHQPILISHDVYERVREGIRCRIVAKIQVKGKTEGVKVYTARSMLTPDETKAWAVHEEAVAKYYARDFRAASEGFGEVLALLPDDFPASHYLESAKLYARTPPPADWDGVEVLTEK